MDKLVDYLDRLEEGVAFSVFFSFSILLALTLDPQEYILIPWTFLIGYIGIIVFRASFARLNDTKDE